MECTQARDWLFRMLDNELEAPERRALNEHLSACASCTREHRILTLPQRIAKALPPVEVSPYFYSRLRARLRDEAQPVTMWQLVVALSHRMVPALALLTLALLGIFAWEQMGSPAPDVYQAYDRIFMSADRPHRMVIADQDDITDDSVVRAIAEEEPEHGIQFDTGRTPR
jgi:hypothetical protein